MKKFGAFLLFLCMLCTAAVAQDGLVGLWRWEYNDNITLFHFMADGTYKMVISTNDQQGSIMSGKYKVSGNTLVMTENVYEGERSNDFSYVYSISGDTAMFGDYECVRVPEKDVAFLLANPYAPYTIGFTPQTAMHYLKKAVEQRMPYGYYLADEDYETKDDSYSKHDDDVYLLGASTGQIRGGTAYCFEFSAFRLFGGRGIVFADGAVVLDIDDSYKSYRHLFPFEI